MALSHPEAASGREATCAETTPPRQLAEQKDWLVPKTIVPYTAPVVQALVVHFFPLDHPSFGPKILGTKPRAPLDHFNVRHAL